MTQTNKNNFKRTIRICYPAGTGTLVIRTDLDWERDINPVAVSSDGNTATFEIEAQQRFVHFKPCLIKNGSLHWAVGPDKLVPAEQLFLRTTNDPEDRSMWGSSLGGVVSFYSAWEYPSVFGGAVCMSSTFSYKDDLIERVLNEPTRDVRFYLDSGWPNDNYEVTTEMALALVSRGWRYGCDFINLVFPHAVHDEKAWGMRLHLPMQFFTGAVARASRAMIS